MRYCTFTVTLCFFVINSIFSFGQTQKVVADKIIAKVGDKIILESDINNAIADYKRQGQATQLPENPECSFLEGQMIQKLLVLQAERDSIPVSEEEVENGLDNKIRYFIQMYGSKDALEQVAGKTIYQLKETFRSSFRESKLADAMKTKILEFVRITPLEVKNYFNAIPKDSLPYYETQLELKKIVLYPKAHSDVDQYIINELQGFKKKVESGVAKFEQLAVIYSQDPGSKDNGGKYIINRGDKFWDPVFYAAVFKLRTEGQVSPVIHSKFGYHIIQLVYRAGDEATIRHILLIPPISENEIMQTESKLDSIRSSIIKNNIPFNQAVTLYSEDESSKFNGGAVAAPDGSNYISYDQLTKDEVEKLQKMSVGDISAPYTYVDERGKKCVAILYLKYRSDPHQENLREDFDKIAQRALEDKKRKALTDWFIGHVKNFYVMVDPAYVNCFDLDNMKHWKSVIRKE